MAVNITNATSAIKVEITAQVGKHDPEVYFLEKSLTNISYDLATGVLKLTNVKYDEFRFPFADVAVPAEADIVALANTVQGYKNSAGPAMPLPAGASTEAKQDAQIVQETAIKVAVESINTKTPVSPATEGKQDTGNTSLATIAGKDFSTEATLVLIKAKTDNLDVLLSTRTKPADTQAISAASLPLPTGAATSALQTQPGVDIGDVTVNNGAGASAVNIQDGGNSITIDQPTASSLNAQVVGNVAHDAADSGNPIKVGGKAKTSDITPVANDDRVDALFTKLGKQVVMPYTLPDSIVSGLTASMTGTGDTAVIAAQGANVAIFVTNILVTNGHATVGTYVNIKDGATSIYTGYAAAAGGGFSVTLPTPLKLTANTALNAANVTTGSDVRVSASGYKASTL